MRCGRGPACNPEGAMKVNDFAYQVCGRTMELLEETQHYKIPPELQKEVCEKILSEVHDILKRSK